MSKINYLLIGFFIFTAMLFKNCQKNSSPLYESNIQLSVHEVGITEAFICIKCQREVIDKNNLKIERNGIQLKNYTITENLILHDKGLQPNQNYLYKAYIIEYDKKRAESNVLDITTMDTTEHDITWNLYRFGNIASSNLMDVWIIDNERIWAVGEIWMDDESGGSSYDRFSAISWDGKEWHLKKIFYETGSNAEILKIIGIWCFTNNIYWFAWGSVFLWDGDSYATKSYQRNTETNERVKIFWGSDTSKIYAAGTEGILLFYDGLSWEKIQIDLSEDINDIWGWSHNAEQLVLGVAADTYGAGNEYIFKINLDQSIEFETYPKSDHYSHLQLNSVWFNSPTKIMVGGNGLFVRDLGSDWEEIYFFRQTPFIRKIRGSEKNNIFFLHDGGMITHFNGFSWKTFGQFPLINWNNLSIKDDLIIVVGNDSQFAYILMGEMHNTK